jgi:glutamate synthase domain-containing protein 3
MDRSAGTLLSGKITRAFYPRILEEDTIRLKLEGSAGQAFGAFVCPGLTLDIEGEANDYTGKGLSGGILAIYPPKPLVPHEHFIAGYTCLYGATSGRAFIAGRAGQRFCVRNSGASAVVESAGDHCCEYMTGGRTVVLGTVGENFAAGMSGGIAYVWDPERQLRGNCNMELVELFDSDAWWPEDEPELRALVEEHARRTGSIRAKELLDSWSDRLLEFVKVFPTDYRKVLEAQKATEAPKVVEELYAPIPPTQSERVQLMKYDEIEHKVELVGELASVWNESRGWKIQ